ncbi:MAG TPA: ATP-binding protein [Thermoplasmata archaeon]|nr:ATP-binding protein [Thermoplasmata archaeon]
MTAPRAEAGRPRAVVSWSTGKDCAWALAAVRAEGALDVVGLLTTVTETFGRVSMHGVRESVLDLQAAAAGLPVLKVPIPFPCPNAVYEAAMGRAVAALRADGVSHVVFGDLFLEDVRAYREERLRGTGLSPVFPLWGRPTRALAEEMIAGGLRATLVAVDPRKLDRSFAGRPFDAALLRDLPADVDPCGERGEFHSCATAGPMFSAPIRVAPGPVVDRDGFAFADLVPA